jgi:hypothetical protein
VSFLRIWHIVWRTSLLTLWVSLWSTLLTLAVLWFVVSHWLKVYQLELPWKAISESLVSKKATVPQTKAPAQPVAATTKEDLVVLQTEDLQRMKANLTAAERTELFSIIMKKLPPEKINELSKWLENGLTSREIVELERVIKQHFSENERNIFITKLK